MSHHHDKVSSILQRAVQKVVGDGLQDPRTEGAMITVTSVQLSDDEHNATVNVSVLPEKYEARVRAALEHSKGYIRRQAAEMMSLKLMPQLSFVIDKSLKKQAEILQALSRVNAEREQSAAKSPIAGDTTKPASDSSEQETPRGNP